MPRVTTTCDLCGQEYEAWANDKTHRGCPVAQQRHYADELFARFVSALALTIPLPDLNAAALIAAAGRQTWVKPGEYGDHTAIPNFAYDVLTTLHADPKRAGEYLRSLTPPAPKGAPARASSRGSDGFGTGLAVGFLLSGGFG